MFSIRFCFRKVGVIVDCMERIEESSKDYERLFSGFEVWVVFG